MKNVLLFLLSLVLVASVVEAKIVNDSIYQIPKTKVAPVIDGIQDQIWKALDWNMQRIYNVGDPPTATSGADSGVGLSGLSKVMWDANNIYVLFYTVDDVIVEHPTNGGYDQDGVELYFDGANDHTAESGLKATQFHLTFPHWLIGQEVGHLGTAFGTTFDTTGCEFIIRDVMDTEGFPGWMLEVKIPLTSLGIDGSTPNQLIGFELQQNEADDPATGRQSMSKWWSNSNNSWQNAGIWGTAILADREVDTVLVINKVSGTAPTIDGVWDDVYKTANIVTMNLFRIGDPPAAESPVVDSDPMFGGFITAYPLWDATNFYIFCDVVDAIIVEIPTNGGYNQDGVELYFDGANDHTSESGLKATQFHLTFPHWLLGHEVGNLGTAFGTAIDTTGIEFKLTDHDQMGNAGVRTEEGSGYNLEVKIPLTALGIDASSLPAELGFEIQLNNSSDQAVGRGGMEKWWSPSNNSWQNAGIWGYAKLAGPTSVKGTPPSVASSYKLGQNYPNPFNPTTQITFELAKSEKVKLAVYNLLGEQVAVLVNGTRNAGSQTVTYNAKNLSSGVYFYKLEAGSTVLTKKMMLLK